MIFQNIKLSESQEKIVLVLAAYGIVQVLAQDLGIKTGKKQRDLVQKMPVQIALLFASEKPSESTFVFGEFSLFFPFFIAKFNFQ